VARPFRHVGRDADKGNAPALRAEQARRIVPPSRGQDDLRAGTLQ